MSEFTKIEKLFINAFNNEHGKALLKEYLIPEYYEDPVATDDMAAIHRSLGRRDVVIEILDILKRHKNNV